MDRAPPPLPMTSFAPPATPRVTSQDDLNAAWERIVQKARTDSKVDDESSGPNPWDEPHDPDEFATEEDVFSGKGKQAVKQVIQPAEPKKRGRPPKKVEFAPTAPAPAAPAPAPRKAPAAPRAKSKASSDLVEKTNIVKKILAYKRLIGKAKECGKEVNLDAAEEIDATTTMTTEQLNDQLIAIRSILHSEDGVKIARASYEGLTTAIEYNLPDIFDPFDMNIRGLTRVLKSDAMRNDVDLALEEFAIERLGNVSLSPTIALGMLTFKAMNMTTFINKNNPELFQVDNSEDDKADE